ncbi:glycosyltransferase family 4 protein [Ramlibacter sp.]|uniref:glycosyltransferase family 4 protein n=1 Tax=Ramlibacter sp. TaxID=1917967 RepID=UPI002BC11EEB|nr:glycosyltransferase family 4 protein [Ramlibacter sp.]HWI83110.1 glycosyltransferase family 4 protein [Ramlibacter sp.]
MSSRKLRIAVVSNSAWNLFNFRLNLIRCLQAAGHTVVAVAPSDRFGAKLELEGITFRPVAIAAHGVNPLAELRAVWQLGTVFRREAVDLVLSYTPKGNLYSALACVAVGVRFVPNVSGLGRAFIRRSPITWMALALYRLTFPRAHHVFFQNFDDMNVFVKAKLVHIKNAERLPGSGVDLARFQPIEGWPQGSSDAPVFLLVARMLWDKGVGEYVTAARTLRASYPRANFRLLGDLASSNPSAIPKEQVDAWVKEGLITYLGSTEDVRPFVAEADCIVLPSYREGVPRVLLEAAAMARPVITTDAPGCRDAVVDGETGFLCRPRDGADLAAKMRLFLDLPLDQRHLMGRRGREMVQRGFDELFVLDRYRRLVATFAVGGQPEAGWAHRMPASTPDVEVINARRDVAAATVDRY